jgi:outer membrane protein assembly factor BamE (lipoprotein component of BamABCDE complex)
MRPMKRILILITLAAVMALNACGSKLTEDNLQKIHNGMTTDEVKAILGAPTNVQSTGVFGVTGTTYIYHTDTSDVKITFLNDKVIATEGEFK